VASTGVAATREKYWIETVLKSQPWRNPHSNCPQQIDSMIGVGLENKNQMSMTGLSGFERRKIGSPSIKSIFG